MDDKKLINPQQKMTQLMKERRRKKWLKAQDRLSRLGERKSKLQRYKKKRISAYSNAWNKFHDGDSWREYRK